MANNGLKVTLDLDTGKRVIIRGCTSLSGERYFKIRYGGQSAYVAQSLFVAEKVEARKGLNASGVTITSDPDWRAIVQAIEGVKRFQHQPLLDKPGWSDGYYAEANGYVHTPRGKRRGRSIFPPLIGSEGSIRGNHEEWMERVAVPLTGQTLPIFFVLLALASPLVRFFEAHNFGFELWGPPAKGKTTLLSLMASVVGNPTHLADFNSTQAGREKQFPLMQDRPFPVDEVNLMSVGDRQELINFAFRMANGSVKVSFFAQDHAHYRFIFATSSNRPIHDIVGSGDTSTSAAALQRLFPLKVSEDDLGVFDFIPDGFAGSGAFATYLGDAMRKFFGTPYREFVKAIVQSRDANSEQFDSTTRGYISDFTAEVGISETGAGQSRASNAIGLVYAAGEFAKARGVIPSDWDCLAACLAVYRNYQAQLPGQTPLAARIASIISETDTMDLRSLPELPRLSNGRFNRHGAFVYQGVKGRVELLITPEAKQKWFPDWKALTTKSDFDLLIIGKKPRYEVQRKVRANRGKEWFAAFIIPFSLVPPLN